MFEILFFIAAVTGGVVTTVASIPEPEPEPIKVIVVPQPSEQKLYCGSYEGE